VTASSTTLSESSPPRIGGTAFPWRAVAVLLCVAAAQVPFLVAHARQIWLRPHYQFAPLLLVGAAVLAWQRLPKSGPLTPGSAWGSYLLVGLAWTTLAAAELLNSSWLGAVAGMILLAALLYGLGGGALFWRGLPAWLLLWLAIPPPFEYDRVLILSLQSLTAQWSSAILDFLGVYHVMAGNVVEVSGQKLLVEQACGGINSLLAILACTLFYIFFARRPLAASILLILAAAAWVLVANVARVVGMAYLYTRWGLDLTAGWRHEAFGLGLFALALLMIWSTDRLLQFFLAPSASGPLPKGNDASMPDQASRPTFRGTWLTAWPIGVAYALLAMAHLALYVTDGHGDSTHSGPVIAGLESLKEESLPDRVGDYRRLAFAVHSRNPGSEFGEVSRVWTYQHEAHTATVSLDYTFPGWHDLSRCYTSQGWSIDRETVVPEEGHVMLQLSKPGYRTGYLLFCQFDRQGELLSPRTSGAGLSLTRQASVLNRWLSRWRGVNVESATDSEGPIYQAQLFIEGYSPLSLEEQTKAGQLFVKAREQLLRHCFPQRGE
jgi:exosortase